LIVRLDTARKRNGPGLAIPLPPRPGTKPHLLPSGSDPGGRRREVRRDARTRGEATTSSRSGGDGGAGRREATTTPSTPGVHPSPSSSFSPVIPSLSPSLPFVRTCILGFLIWFLRVSSWIRSIWDIWVPFGVHGEART